MNIYLLNEDGEHFCIMAETMQEAVKTGEDLYIASLTEQELIDNNEKSERQYYHDSILESCALIAELKN